MKLLTVVTPPSIYQIVCLPYNGPDIGWALKDMMFLRAFYFKTIKMILFWKRTARLQEVSAQIT